MRRYWLVVFGLMVVLLVIFGVVEALGIAILVDPTPWMATPGIAAASVGVGLLVGDVILPVPSSLVMIAHGALFGLWLGALLSLIGSLGGALLAFLLGRRGDPILDRFVTPEGRARADRLLQRWGPLAIVVTRPVPVLAETTVILAGASGVRWRVAIAAVLIGSVPVVLIFAYLGATASATLA